MIDKSHFKLLFGTTHQKDHIHKQLLGKFLVHNGQLHVLSDYQGLLGHLPDGPISPHTQSKLDQLHRSSHFSVEDKDNHENKKHLDNLLADQSATPTPAKAPAPPLPNPIDSRPAVFDYQHVGMDKPHTLEIHGAHATLDGNILDPQEVQTIRDHVKTKVATLTHKKTAQELTKALEEQFFSLHKAEGQTLQKLFDSKHLKPEDHQELSHEMYDDEAIPSIQNAKALKEHLTSGVPGVFIHAQINGHKTIKDLKGHNAADQAAIGVGDALRQALDKIHPEGKIFHTEHDKFVLHVPSHEHASHALRQIRDELDAHPPIGGTHRLSLSVGVAPSYDESRSALDQALHDRKGQQENPLDSAKHTLYVHTQSAPVPNVEAVPTLAPLPPKDNK